jgi:hypothetical protein
MIREWVSISAYYDDRGMHVDNDSTFTLRIEGPRGAFIGKITITPDQLSDLLRGQPVLGNMKLLEPSKWKEPAKP